MNDPAFTELEKAAELIQLPPKLKSTIMPKFFTFLAKKKRLNCIKVICFEYVQSLYWNQGITPVRVTSAQRLSEDQISKSLRKGRRPPFSAFCRSFPPARHHIYPPPHLATNGKCSTRFVHM